jgi:hypothetical protein
MITHHHHTKHRAKLTLLATATTMVAMLAAVVAVAQATPPPVKLSLSNHITSGLGASEEYPMGVAVDNDPASPEYGDVYMAELGAHRVVVLSGSGAFVEVFGTEVNETTEGNVCTAVSHDTCQFGAGGASPGQFSNPESITIDPTSGDVYVAEQVSANGERGLRVQEFTAAGGFVLEIGREVNVTKDKEPGATETEKNLCTELEIEKRGECGAPTQEILDSGEDGAFDFGGGHDTLLAIGGKEGVLYVGDEHRVQEFDVANGKWVGEIPLASLSDEQESEVKALALDQETGDLYLNYASGNVTSNVIREFDPENNDELASFSVNPRKAGEEVDVQAMALDPSGRLAVAAIEKKPSTGENNYFGSLYDAASGRRVTEFATPTEFEFAFRKYDSGTIDGIGFSSTGALYVAANNYVDPGEILAYTPEPIGELTIGGSGCAPGAESDTSMTFACTLKGEANPEGVPDTETFFAYGRTPNLGETTTPEKISATEPVHTVVSLHPNAKYYYQLSGYDNNAMPPEEPFASEQATLTTETVPPHIGAPSIVAARPSSATLFSELNPENAATEYHFEYAQSAQALAACTITAREHEGGCPGVQNTPVENSATYGSIGAKAEITALQPGTTYYYRLFAENESAINPGERLHTTGPEASFTTEPTPLPSAQTGAYSAVTPTGATITGAVNPDGTPAGYAFELGIYNGANTQYTIVYSAEAGSGSIPVEESLPLTGLQPGTTYAYRIAVSSGYIANEAHALQGDVVTFTTAGIPAVLVSPISLATLPIPAIAFPAESAGTGTSTAKGLTRAQKLAAALKTCRKDRSRSKRAKCERAARKSDGPAKAARKARGGARSAARRRRPRGRRARPLSADGSV